MTSQIILIGGSAGTGKSTLAKNLGTDHRLGTGFIREIIREHMPEDPYIHKHTFQGSNPIQTIQEQAKTLKPYIQRCIRRARNEGTSLTIEGTHILPNLYNKEDYDYMIILECNNIEKTRLTSSTHSQRKINDKDIEGIRRIAEYLKIKAQENNIPILLTETTVQQTVEEARGIIDDRWKPIRIQTIN